MAHREMNEGWRRVRTLGWPISLQAVATTSFALLDAAMVQSLGPEALAAVGLAGRTLFLLTMIVMGLASGAGVLLAQYAGQRDGFAAGRILRLLALLVLGLTALPALLLQLRPELLAAAFGLEPAVTTHFIAFMQGVAWTPLLTGLLAALAAVSRCYGDSRAPLAASIVALLLNALLNAVLIFGLAGLPAMGVAGAAVATTVAKLAELALLIVLVRQRFSHWPELLRGLRAPEWRVPHFGRLALPFMLQEALWSGGLLAYSLVYAAMGRDALALMSLAGPLGDVMITLFYGFSAACGVVVGQWLGQARYAAAAALARHVLFRLLRLAVPVCAVGGVLAMVVVLQLPWLQAQRGDAMAVALLVAVTVLVRVAAMTLVLGVLRAGGDRLGVLRIDLAMTWLVGVPLVATAALLAGARLPTLCLLLLVLEMAKVALLWARMERGVWLRRWTVTPPAAQAAGAA